MKLSDKNFSKRLMRIQENASKSQHYAPRKRRRKRRWWLLAVVALLAFGLLFRLTDGFAPKPTYDDIFAGTSKAAYSGELEEVTFQDFGFALDIPSDWRERTSAEIAASGNSWGADDRGVAIKSYTITDSDSGGEFIFEIASTRAPNAESDPLDLVSSFHHMMTSNLSYGVLFKLLGAPWYTVEDPARVVSTEVPAADVILRMTLGDEQGTMLLRTYVIGTNFIHIAVIWTDTGVHPSAFETVLNSLREL